MQAQGSSLVNTAYFSQLTARVNNINTCAELQSVVNSVMGSLQAELSSVESQITALLPLTSLPTDLGSVISWIGHLASPYVTAYGNLIAQRAQMLSEIASLASAIENAASRIENCAVQVASII